MKGLKKPWIAALLALALGGLGYFYLDWRRGAKATLAWLFAVCLILAGPPFPESIISSALLVHGVLAWKAYRSSKRTNAEAANATPLGAGSKLLTGWKRAAWAFNKTVTVTVRSFGLILVWFLVEFYFVGWHYVRMQRSIRSGMTIEEVLHMVQESGLVNGYPQHLEGDEARGIAFSGPHDNHYGVLYGVLAREVSEAEAATLLQQNMVPGRDYRIGFTFTPMYGPHWSMTVILSPEGRVKEVRPFHTWD